MYLYRGICPVTCKYVTCNLNSRMGTVTIGRHLCPNAVQIPSESPQCLAVWTRLRKPESPLAPIVPSYILRVGVKVTCVPGSLSALRTDGTPCVTLLQSKWLLEARKAFLMTHRGQQRTLARAGRPRARDQVRGDPGRWLGSPGQGPSWEGTLGGVWEAQGRGLSRVAFFCLLSSLES